MARYLVTGAAGFIAATVAEQLLAEGHSVLGPDSLEETYDVRLKLWRLQRLQGQASFQFQRLDIRDRSELNRAWTTDSPFDAVIHLAARAGVRQSVEEPWSYLETSVAGTLKLLEMCRSHRVPKFVLASRSCQ